MFKNYLKTALRNIARHKGYSLINLLGLSIGIACCILILLYVQDEFKYDRYVPDYKNTHRIVLDIETPEGGEIHMARTPPPWGPSLAEEYPEVESYMRFKTPLVSWLVSNESENKRFHEKGFYFADHTVFDFFDFELLKGDPETALLEPRTVVLTETAAGRYFGNQDPMGQTLRLDNTHDFLVTGVMQDVPGTRIFRSISWLPFPHWVPWRFTAIRTTTPGGADWPRIFTPTSGCRKAVPRRGWKPSCRSS